MEEKLESVEEKVDEVAGIVEVVEENFNAADDNLEKVNKLLEEYEQKEVELFQREVTFTLKQNDLEAFASIVKVDSHEELEATVDALKAIVNDIKMSAGYVPKEIAKQEEYNIHVKNKDTKSMIGSKLANLFK